MKASDFKVKLATTGGSIKITTANGTEKVGTNNVGTGDQVRVYDASGVHQTTYTVVVYGDTDGDGSIKAVDYVQVRKYLLGTFSLSGYNELAADTNKNGKVDAVDYVQIRKQILGQYLIRQ